MTAWIITALLSLTVVGVIASWIANRRFQMMKRKEKRYAQCKGLLLQLESMVDALLRGGCRQDITDTMLKYYVSLVKEMSTLFPQSPENGAFKKLQEQLSLRSPVDLSEEPVTDAGRVTQIKTQMRQAQLMLSTLRSDGFVSAALSEEWSKYLSVHPIVVEIEGYIAQSNHYLNEGDRSKSSNSLRTAQSKLSKNRSMPEEQRKAYEKTIADKIKAMYGLDGDNEESGAQPEEQ